MLKISNIEYIRELFNKFKNTNEDTIKNNVVRYMLETLGYDPLDFYYEHQMYHNDGRSDIAIKIGEKIELYVEVKDAKSNLGSKEVGQLARYLNERNLSWGILTNGQVYMLVNNDIDAPSNFERPIMNDKVVLSFDIFNDVKHIEYFTKSSLFDTKITNFFRDISQFKAYKYPDNEKSWRVYKGTLYEFFTYYSKHHQFYLPLDQIRVHEFEKYLLDDQNRKKLKNKNVNSEATFNAKYSHIRSFYKTLYEANYIKSHNFDEPKKLLLERMEKFMSKKKESTILETEQVREILRFYDNDTKYGLRNKTIFLLSLFAGCERSTILNLRVDMIKGNKLHLKNRVLPIPLPLQVLFEELISQKKQKKIKDPYLFHIKRDNKYTKASTSAINSIYSSLEKVGIPNITSTSMRINLVKKMFSNNYPIQQIAYFTGMDLKNLSNIILWDDIVSQVQSNKKTKPIHPYEEFFL